MKYSTSTGRVLAILVFGVALCTHAGVASASEKFPAQVKDHLKLTCVPQCTLCHSTNPGTLASIGTPFGSAFLGAKAAAMGDVAGALEGLRAKMLALDVDGNGVNDIEQIEFDNTNPNQNGEAICGPTYGCGAHVEPRSSFSWGTLLAGGFVAGVGLLRFRSRRSNPGAGVAGPRR
ncbi:MAG: hypothetical protein SFV15_00270 [Polyangiaceae bacterium]|nr:hypothetical protein [Polyangiaceae bacterium]